MKPFPFRVTLFFILAFMLAVVAHPAHSPTSAGVLAAADRAIPPVAQPPAPVSAQADIYHYFTDFEREVRSTRIYGVPLVVVVSADTWVSPKEGRVVMFVQHRWHLTIVRRVK